MSVNATTAGASTAGNAAVLLIGRILLSIMFIYAGFGKLTAIGGTAGWFASLGLPAPTLVAIVVGLLEFFGGLAILVGFQTRLFAFAIAAFTIGALLVAHTDFADQIQQLMFLKN